MVDAYVLQHSAMLRWQDAFLYQWYCALGISAICIKTEESKSNKGDSVKNKLARHRLNSTQTDMQVMVAYRLLECAGRVDEDTA